MKYTKYFSFITKENGAPQLHNHQYDRMMNIIHVEGVITGVNKVRYTYKNTPEYNNARKYKALIDTQS